MRGRTCSIEGCGAEHFGRGWCRRHYTRWLRHGDPLTNKREGRVCDIEDCGRPHFARGWCNMHYTRWARNGDPLLVYGLREDATTKRCPDCGETKPLDDFYRRDASSDTPRRSRCKRCVNRRAAAHAQGPGRERLLAYRAANRDQNKVYSRRYYEANTEKYAEWARERRARVRGVTVESFTAAEIFERDEWTCGICGDAVDRTLLHPDPGSPSLDHVVPLSRGGEHSRANVQLAHHGCNSGKRDRLPEELACAT